MTTNHNVDVFPLGELAKHPNADSLSLIKIGDTDYTYVAKTDEWKEKVGKLVAWVPPESVVKLERPEFSFLNNISSKHKNRIKARKIRGVVSYGLLVLAPDGLRPGEDAAAALEVSHYEPAPPKTQGQGGNFYNTNAIPGPNMPGYDVDQFLKYGRKVFTPGERVYVSEKLHGACGRYTFVDGKMYCGSRNEWKSEFALPSTTTFDEILTKVGDPEKAQKIFDKISKPGKNRNMWWDALTPEVEEYCKANPGHCVYGEVYGNVQDMKYGATNEYWFRAFDVLLPSGQWMDAGAFTCLYMARVPVIALDFPFDFDAVRAMCEGKSTLADHIREGIVVKPMTERWDQRIGRVSLKCINPAYLES